MRNYQLYLIRHGITEGNLKGLYVGSGTDLPLCEEGRSQLYALRDRFLSLIHILFRRGALVPSPHKGGFCHDSLYQ